MRIDPNLTVNPIAKEPTTKKESVSTGRTKTRPDVVSISSAGAAAADMPARLATIKAQLASGTYPIDLDKLAKRITEEELK
jgi:anti-sigma28 factor (negative regulator of flagellin synthesis)